MSYNHRPAYQIKQLRPLYHDQALQDQMLGERGEQRYDDGYTQAWDNNNHQYKQKSGNGIVQYTSDFHAEDYVEQPQQQNQVRINGRYEQGPWVENYTLRNQNAVPYDDIYEYQEQPERHRAQYSVYEQNGYLQQNGAPGNSQRQHNQRTRRLYPPRNNSLPHSHPRSQFPGDSRSLNGHGNLMQLSRAGMSNGYINSFNQIESATEPDRHPRSGHGMGQSSGSNAENRSPGESAFQAYPRAQPKSGQL